MFATLWTVAHQAPLSMGFYKQEYLSGLPFPPPDFCLYSKIIQLNRIGQKLLLGFSITSYVHMHTFFFFPLDCLFYKDWIRVGENHKWITLFSPMDYTVHGLLQARTLEWVAYPFSSRSSQPRNRTRVSRIAGGFFTSWATREARESQRFKK